MKLRTLTLAAGLTFLSMNAFAATQNFKKIDNNIETQACYAAATKGLDDAKAIVDNAGYNFRKFRTEVTCNGLSIDDFAEKYANTEDNQEPIRLVALRAVNNEDASMLCLDAAVMGERAAREKHGMRHENIMCNGQTLRSFLRSLKNSEIVENTVKDDVIAKTGN